MEWLQAFMIAGSTIGACYYMHREHSREAKEHNREVKDMNDKFNEEMRNFHNEMRSFHGRLCTLEERYLQMLQKIFEGKN